MADNGKVSGVRLGNEHWDIIARRAGELGHNNQSAALRRIVEDYDQIAAPVERYLAALDAGDSFRAGVREGLHGLMDELIEERARG